MNQLLCVLRVLCVEGGILVKCSMSHHIGDTKKKVGFCSL